jgi:hypothetical protein
MSSATVMGRAPLLAAAVPASRARQRVSCKPEPQRTASRHHAGDNRLLSGTRRVAPNRKRHRLYARIVADCKLSILRLLRPLSSSRFLQPPCLPILRFSVTSKVGEWWNGSAPAHPREPVADDAAGFRFRSGPTILRTHSGCKMQRSNRGVILLPSQGGDRPPGQGGSPGTRRGAWR